MTVIMHNVWRRLDYEGCLAPPSIHYFLLMNFKKFRLLTGYKSVKIIMEFPVFLCS